MPSIHVIHGPNLNLLGTREPEAYGTDTLADINAAMNRLAVDLGVSVCTYQFNGEGDIIDAIQAAGQNAEGILLNPAGYTHTSVAIRDAVAAVSIPTIEVHLSNTYAREPFRHKSLVAGVVRARVLGFGAASYELALRDLVKIITAG